MNRTKKTFVFFYDAWVKKAQQDIEIIKEALKTRDMKKLGETVEKQCSCNARSLAGQLAYDSLLDAPETVNIFHNIWALRKQGAT